MILTALRQYLLSQSSVTDLVDQRIFPVLLPQGEPTPAVDIRQVGGTTTSDIEGWIGHTQTQVVIDCYSDDDPDQAAAVAAAIRDCGILRYRGLAGVGATRVFIHGALLDNNVTIDTEGVEPGSDRYRWVATLALRIDYSDASEI
jgi:hypothetical protein